MQRPAGIAVVRPENEADLDCFIVLREKSGSHGSVTGLLRKWGSKPGAMSVMSPTVVRRLRSGNIRPAHDPALGILNITADSFSDGGRYLDPAAALARAARCSRAGHMRSTSARRSSNPDAAPVGAGDGDRAACPGRARADGEGAAVSIDSFEPEVQLWAMAQGVAWLNDIQGFPDPAFYPALARSACGLIVMHSVAGQGEGAAPRRAARRDHGRLFAFFRCADRGVDRCRDRAGPHRAGSRHGVLSRDRSETSPDRLAAAYPS